jgi:hypothetical protein
MSESREHLLTEAESSYRDSSSPDDRLPLRRRVSEASFTKSPSLWKYARLAAYTWAALCTVPALLFLVDTASRNVYSPYYLPRRQKLTPA